MCFSAGASFGVSAVLLATGITAIKKTQTSLQIPFAAIPLFFSIQQFSEGVLWLSLTNPEYANWHLVTTYTFLLFAQVVWPVWLPLSIWLLEKDTGRKKILMALFCLGIILSIYLAYCLLFYDVDSRISGYHIRYDLDFPHNLIRLSSLFYFIPTVIPAFVSSIRKMRIMGVMILVSFLISQLFFNEYIVSVWCFFAAIISTIVLFIIIAFQTASEKSPELTA